MYKYARDEKIHSERKHSKHKIGKDFKSHLWYLCEFFLRREDIRLHAVNLAECMLWMFHQVEDQFEATNMNNMLDIQCSF